MAAYRLFGSTGSPYSVKVRSYMRFKGIPHVWLVRNTPELQQEHAQHAKLPLVPLVIVPDGSEAFQDSTPIIENFEAERPTPTIHPASVPLRFVSELLEEFADEWGNKWMFHYRWAHEQDGRDYARRIACEMRSGVPPPEDPEALESELKQLSDMFCDRMFGRLFTIGSTGQTRPIIEASRGLLLGDINGVPTREVKIEDQSICAEPTKEKMKLDATCAIKVCMMGSKSVAHMRRSRAVEAAFLARYWAPRGGVVRGARTVEYEPGAQLNVDIGTKSVGRQRLDMLRPTMGIISKTAIPKDIKAQ